MAVGDRLQKATGLIDRGLHARDIYFYICVYTYLRIYVVNVPRIITAQHRQVRGKSGPKMKVRLLNLDTAPRGLFPHRDRGHPRLPLMLASRE
jgi:hypothetical protein